MKWKNVTRRSPLDSPHPTSEVTEEHEPAHVPFRECFVQRKGQTRNTHKVNENKMVAEVVCRASFLTGFFFFF